MEFENEMDAIEKISDAVAATWWAEDCEDDCESSRRWIRVYSDRAAAQFGGDALDWERRGKKAALRMYAALA